MELKAGFDDESLDLDGDELKIIDEDGELISHVEQAASKTKKSSSTKKREYQIDE